MLSFDLCGSLFVVRCLCFECRYVLVVVCRLLIAACRLLVVCCGVLLSFVCCFLIVYGACGLLFSLFLVPCLLLIVFPVVFYCLSLVVCGF